ncbi:hypothetical protein NQ318_008474 [Aromia moschata]|uniref:C2H2-type domain-containing protein n=1 Tax=Aromia moschata TaxID=1265417 RepID=A0AAV8YA43_9CUCU|nr:hypothetical protein NQ318_008474 [Aromia moschata]
MDRVEGKLSKENNTELNSVTLEECFKNIIEGNALELDMNTLNNILRRDLQINFNILKPKVKTILSYMLVHFIKSWPGWQRSNNYMSRLITFENWYAKFKEYLIFKINYLIKNDFEKVSLMLKTSQPFDESILFKIDDGTQTIPVTEKPQAPYSIEVQGLPKMLNSLVFCKAMHDDIIVKEYKINPLEEKLTTKQLINWPHIEVEFASKELRFKRKNVHGFKRYLMFSTEKITFKKAEALIEEIDIINEEISRAAYTLNILKEYCKLYGMVLKKHQALLGLTDEAIQEVETVLEEFVSDITEINMNSIATNTSVVFNIGSCIYARNKSVRSSSPAICFAESVTPKMNILLYDFTAVKGENNVTQFELLKEISDSNDKTLIYSILPIFKYTCTFCNKIYKNQSKILEHLRRTHCTEQPVLCFTCKLELNITKLAENRWRHQCSSSGNRVGN